MQIHTIDEKYALNFEKKGTTQKYVFDTTIKIEH